MTCVVAIKHQDEGNNKITMGADSCISTYRKLPESSDLNSKIIKKTNVLIGVSGSCRLANLIQHEFLPNDSVFSVNSETCEGYMVKHFIKDLKNLFISNGFFDEKKHGLVEGFNFNLLVACYGNLYQVYHDFSVIELEKFGSTGSGASFALGYLYSQRDQEVKNEEDAKTIIKKSIECAAYYDFYVDKNITFNSI